MKTIRSKEYYTIGEVSFITKVPENTIRYWEAKGYIIPSKKVGRRRLYTKKDIRRIMELKYNRKPTAKTLNKFILDDLKDELKTLINEIRKALNENS